jgi:transposase InsO family protein
MKKDEILSWQNEAALRKYQIIAPILDQEIDPARKKELRARIAEKNGISTRTLQRYEAAYRKDGLLGLKPKSRAEGFSSRLPANYEDLFNQAVQLKRELPSRSVDQIIYILEGEARIEHGVLKRSTLQKHLFEAGFGKKQMKKYMEGQKSVSTRRFCKPHRMMLVEADIKYGVGIIYIEHGRRKTAYLSSIIDDHSRHMLASEWYENQESYVVEDIFRKAILKYGKFDKAYVDNGKQYVSKQLKQSCALLDIRIIHAKHYAGWQKGVIEKFHQIVDDFIAEVKLKKPKSLLEINEYWKYFLDEYYENKAHEGIKEYYRSHDVPVPDSGISPLMEWNRDKRPLTFIDAGTVGEAFLYHTTRVVNKGGCIQFKGRMYEVSAALIGATVEITYDPNDSAELTVYYKSMEPFKIKPVVIGSYASRTPEVPAAMTDKAPETSRLLDVIEKKYKERQEKRADAISYGLFGSEDK